MLEALRRGANSWLAKILFGVLIISFGVFWNVSDVITGFGRGSLAKVGGQDITADQFQRAFQNQLYALSDEKSGRMTTETALALGLDRSVLDRLISQSALLSEAHRMKLGLSDEAIAKGVEADPDFRGPDGRFTHSGLEAYLRQIGMSEQTFLALRREDELRRQLAGSITASTVTPKVLVDIAHSFTRERRTVELFNIDAAKMAHVADPDDAKIAEAYEANKTRFMTPATRKAVVAMLTVDKLKSEVKLTDEEVAAYYEETKSSYETPERRRIQQLSFKSKDEALAARKLMTEGGKTFLDVAKETGAKESDVNLGLLTKAQLVDPAIAEAAFTLGRDEISEPVEGRFGVMLVRAIEIEPGKATTLEEVKDQVRDKLATRKAEDMLQDRVNLVEEGRNAGRTLKEISTEHNLVYQEIESVTSDNKGPDGKPALDHPDASTIVQAIFNSSPGLQNETLDAGNGTYAWYDVISITDATPKTLEAARQDVIEYYLDTEQAKKLAEVAKDLTERLQKGEPIATLAAEAGGKEQTREDIERFMSVPDLSNDAVRLAFSLPLNGAANAVSADNKSRVVFKVTAITPAAAPTEDEAKRLTDQLAQSLQNDVLTAYVTGLRNELGVSIDETLLKRVTGAATEEQ